VITVKVLATPRLLADLIARGIESSQIRRWQHGDPPAHAIIAEAQHPPADSAPLTILLPERLEDGLVIVVDGLRREVMPTRAHELHDLIVEFVPSAPPSIS
jgi:hypothetical protein